MESLELLDKCYRQFRDRILTGKYVVACDVQTLDGGVIAWDMTLAPKGDPLPAALAVGEEKEAA